MNKKISVIFFLFSIFAFREAQGENLSKIVDETISSPSKNNILILAKAIKNNRRFSRDLSTEDFISTERAVEAICKIPGHAKYFADEIESLRKSEEIKPRTQQVYYDRWREWYLVDTLRHLPSPETVFVLGHYLYDERDHPPENNGMWLPENAYLASITLSEIGIRNAPVTTRPGDELYKEALKKNREWYEQVKAGKIAFSFKGQNVEYRFKPDGTWETLPISNPPDDAVRPAKLNPKPAPEKAPEQGIQHSKPEDVPNWWPWLWIPALAILAAGWRLLNRRTNSS